MISRRSFLKKSASGLLWLPAATSIVRAQDVVPWRRKASCPSPFALATASTWAANCVTAGEAPTAAVQAAVAQFVCDCVRGGIWSKFKMLNPCAPGTNFYDVTRTPLLAGGGNQPWVSSGGGVNAPEANGLIQLGSPNEWKTGFNPNAQLTNNNCGFTVYAYNATNGSFINLGVQTAASSLVFYAALNFGGTCQGFIADNGHGTSVAYPGNGYFSCNRSSSTDLRMFWANSGNAHAQVGATITNANPNTLPNGAADLGALFDTTAGTSVLQAPATDIYSYISTHDSFSLAESLVEFNAAQNMRIAFGGGYR